jgi:hypothetical protein
MPIKVQCACGAAFAAKDELAGRLVKCPKCQQPLQIPNGSPAAAVAGAAHAQRGAPAPGGRQLAAPLPSQGPGGPPSTHSLFDEVGLKAQQAGTVPCPGCAQPMPVNALVCIKCGYNKKLGRRMETVRQVEEAPLPGGHSVSVNELLDKAAQRIADEKEEERKKTREGLPFWVYGIGIVACIGFMITMMLLPPQIALMTGGVVIYGLALLINLYAHIRIVIIAFNESVGQGICVLIIPCYEAFFIFTHWDQCGGYFLMALATNLVTKLVDFAMQAGLGAEEEDAYRVDPLPPAVAKAGFDYYPIPLRKAEVSSDGEAFRNSCLVRSHRAGANRQQVPSIAYVSTASLDGRVGRQSGAWQTGRGQCRC